MEVMCKRIMIGVCVFPPLADYLGRIELVQDMEFRTAATRIKATSDGHYVVATGTPLQTPQH